MKTHPEISHKQNAPHREGKPLWDLLRNNLQNATVTATAAAGTISTTSTASTTSSAKTTTTANTVYCAGEGDDPLKPISNNEMCASVRPVRQPARHKRMSVGDVFDTFSTLFTKKELNVVTKRLEEIKKAKNGLNESYPRWDLVIVACLCFTVVVTPYEACFMESTSFDGLFVLNRIVDFCFLLDIGFTLNTSYENDDGSVVYSRKLIFKKYLKSWMLVDVLSLIPGPP